VKRDPKPDARGHGCETFTERAWEQMGNCAVPLCDL
jgi:hypothetical protein